MIGQRALDDRRDQGLAPMHVVRQLDEERWSDFVERHPDASIFHTPEMARVFAGAPRHGPSVWATVDEEGAVRALLTPVTIATLGRPLHVFTTRVVAFAGPIVASDGGGCEALELLLSGYRRAQPRSALFTEIRQVVALGDLATPLAASGFAHEDHLNFIVDLTAPEEELWARVAPSARRNVNKARRIGVTIEEAADQGAIAAGYEILEDVYRRIQVPLPDRGLFEAAFRILGPLGRFSMLLARLGDRTIGVMTLLTYKDVVTYWYTGTLREDATSRAGDLLAWHAIASGRARGCRVLDFGGAGRPDEPYGVRDFKAKYGGRLVDFGRDVWVPSRARLRLATTGYRALRRFL